MILSRELGKRIWGGSTNIENGGGGVSSDAIAGLLTGYAKESWVDEHYISIDFFSRLFQAHGTENGSEIDVMPNDMDTTITSVESMFGFWTNLYISALGSNGAAPAGISLGMLTDVTISGTPSAGQVLTFDAVSGKWINANAQAGATALSNLTDVTLASPAYGQVLLYDGTKWINSALKTINGQYIYGSGDLSVGGGASGNYLPLTGGSLSGELYIKPEDGILIGRGGNTINGVAGSNWSRVYINYQSNQDVILCYGGGNVGIGTYNISHRLEVVGTLHTSSDITTDGNLYINNPNGRNTPYLIFQRGSLSDVYRDWRIRNESGDITTDFSYNGNWVSSIRLSSNSEGTGASLEGIYEALKFSRQSWNYICVPASGGALGLNIGEPGTDRTKIAIINNGNVGIGTTSPSYALHVAGTIYATGSITALSDERKKDITGEAGVTVEQIAHAPAVQFLWKDKERRKDGQQVGTLAQYWQKVLPEVVMDKGGELSMQYGVAALVSAIITARKVVDHERRITELEKENERLKEEISQLRLN